LIYIGGFEIFLFPRYMGDGDSESTLENLFGQSALWDALHILLVCERSVCVELRTISSASDGLIRLFILLKGHTANPGLVQEVAYLLPKDYGFHILTSMQLHQVTHPVSRTGGWRIARVRRRSQFVDMPSLLDADERTPRPGGGAFTLNLSQQGSARHLPEDVQDALRDMDMTRYCLPLLGQMKEFPSDRRQVYEELQASAPVIVSITLHLFPDAEIEEDRQVATRFRALVDHLGDALENSGFAHLQSLRRVYDRYFLTRQYVALMTIRIAAENDARTISVAHQMCSWLGGMRAFVIAPPTKSFEDLSSVLTDLRLELPSTAQSPEWTPKIDRLLDSMKAEQIEPVRDPRYIRFLLRLPHVYTLEEVGQLMRLPFGKEQGLPGLTTRMLPPFFPSSQHYDPVLDAMAKHRAPSEDRIRIGRVNQSSSLLSKGSDAGLHWHSIPVRDLCKHALIVGSTGSGKTITTLFLMREIARLKIPFLVIEPVKTEYYDSLKAISGLSEGEQSLRRFNFEGNKFGAPSKDFLAFDPMRLQLGVTVARHVSYLKTCFEAAFPMEPWQALFLENAILDYYLGDPANGGCGLKLFYRGERKGVRIEPGKDGAEARVFPGFMTFCDYFLGYYLDKEFGRPGAKGPPASNDQIEAMRQIFKRRFLNLSRGPLGEAFRLADKQTIAHPILYERFTYLLKRPTVIELDAIPDPDQKSLVMAFLMTFLYERRQVDDLLERENASAGGKMVAVPPVRHVLVVEEAHRLLANSEGGGRGESAGMGAQAKAVSLFVDMLAEIRAFRQSLIIVEQIPTKLVPAAVKNTNLKIMLRITSRDDRDYLGEAMSFNEEQKQFVSFLRAEPPPPLDKVSGEQASGQVQFVAFDENVEQPVLLTLPLHSRPSGERWLFDEYFQ
jgi:hypothetical protein